MIKVLLSDFSNVILFPNDQTYTGSLNKLIAQKGRPQAEDVFWQMYRINTELLDFYSKIKESHQLKAYIYTTGTVQNHPALKKYLTRIFDDIFSVVDIKKVKTDPESFRFLANKLDVVPAEVVFIDDSQTNVEAAKASGIHAIQYESNEQVKKEIMKLL